MSVNRPINGAMQQYETQRNVIIKKKERRYGEIDRSICKHERETEIKNHRLMGNF